MPKNPRLASCFANSRVYATGGSEPDFVPFNPSSDHQTRAYNSARMNIPTALTPFRRSRTTWLGYAMLGYHTLLQALISAIVPFLRAELNLNYARAGSYMSANAAGMMLAGLIGDRLTRRFGRKRSLWGAAAATVLGLGLLLSTLAVFFPDVAEMYQIVLQAWMFLTPIMYTETILPEAYRFWLTNLNPMYHLVKLFRIPLFDGRLPTAPELLIPAGLAFAMLLIGWLVFTSKSDEFAYRL